MAPRFIDRVALKLKGNLADQSSCRQQKGDHEYRSTPRVCVMDSKPLFLSRAQPRGSNRCCCACRLAQEAIACRHVDLSAQLSGDALPWPKSKYRTRSMTDENCRADVDLGIVLKLMLRFLSAHKKLAAALSALVALVLGCWVWDLSAPLRGQLVAHYDLAHGRYRQLTFGLPPPERPTYARVLSERYGIEVRAVAGCIVSKSLISYVHGYNTVSVAAANRRWRRDVFEDSWQEAERIWSRIHPDAGAAGRNAP